MANFKEELESVEAIVFDVDGVFTDGGIIPLVNGDFIRQYNAKDGYSVAYAVRHGVRIIIISGGRGATLESRFKHLGIKEAYLDVADKVSLLRDIVERDGLHPEKIIYMGDDIPDLECMRYVGIPVCPADAATEVIEVSRYVSRYCGGKGCVRDVMEQVLRAKGLWAKDSLGVTTSTVKA